MDESLIGGSDDGGENDDDRETFCRSTKVGDNDSNGDGSCGGDERRDEDNKHKSNHHL